MAEKSFGVKEVNLIGASGTPTITSPNNLNLNANNVAISTNVSIGGTLSVTGNVSVGGTLTYEDVTNIDSVGIITARTSIKVGTGATIKSNGDLFVEGQTILTGIVTTKNSVLIEGGNVIVDIGALNQGYYLYNGNSTHLGLSWSSSASSNYLSGTGSHPLNITNFAGIGILPSSGACSLGYAGSGKLQTTNTGVNVTGAITVNGSALQTGPLVAYKAKDYSRSRYSFSGSSWHEIDTNNRITHTPAASGNTIIMHTQVWGINDNGHYGGYANVTDQGTATNIAMMRESSGSGAVAKSNILSTTSHNEMIRNTCGGNLWTGHHTVSYTHLTLPTNREV